MQHKRTRLTQLELHLSGERELYVPQVMGQSKLVIQTTARATARNMNTAAVLVALTS